MFVCACVFVGVRVVLHTVSMSHDARCQVAILHPVQGGAVTTRWLCNVICDVHHPHCNSKL